MKTSDKGIEIIKQFEGCHLTAYKCPAGKWTVGYGHTAGVIPYPSRNRRENEDRTKRERHPESRK